MLRKIMISLVLTCSCVQMPVLAESVNYSNDIQTLQIQVEKGDLNAQTFLAMHYIDGEDVEQDREKGIALLQDAANKGNPIAQLALGMAYLMGTKGVPQNVEQAEIWLRKSAAQGEPMAIEMLEEIKNLK